MEKTLTTADFNKDVEKRKERRVIALKRIAEYKGGRPDWHLKQYTIQMLLSGATPIETLELGTAMLTYNLYFEDPDPRAFMRKIINGILRCPVAHIGGDKKITPQI